jgi:predicted naringenin-chalcone synthase
MGAACTTTAYVNRIGTATPQHDVHEAFVRTAEAGIADPRKQRLFRKMVERAGIEHRYSHMRPVVGASGVVSDGSGLYELGAVTPTSRRMARYGEVAPDFALQALDRLGIDEERSRITHLVVGSCTGFVAPGLDQLIVTAAGLNPGVERTVVGFMGCYAAVNSLRLAHHFVRSTPAARVLVVNLELCTLHFQETPDLERSLAMLLFADGCSAALVSADECGLSLTDFRSVAIADSSDAITWRIGDEGFDMHLSGATPGLLNKALRLEAQRNDPGGLLRGTPPAGYDLWAVHAGGRSILDAVEQAFDLAPQALDWSRGVLRDFGNMSSATLMFVLERLMREARIQPKASADGFALAFGPGLAAESFRFSLAA